MDTLDRIGIELYHQRYEHPNSSENSFKFGLNKYRINKWNLSMYIWEGVQLKAI